MKTLKTLIIIPLIFGMNSFYSNAQENLLSDSTAQIVTQKSYEYFCDSIIKKDSVLLPFDIYFSGIANKERSSIDNIAECFGYLDFTDYEAYISTIKDIEGISDKEKEKKTIPMVLGVDSSKFALKRSKVTPYLIICSPLTYGDFIYQEYVVIFGINKYVSISIRMNKESFEPLSHCVLEIYS